MKILAFICGVFIYGICLGQGESHYQVLPNFCDSLGLERFKSEFSSIIRSYDEETVRTDLSLCYFSNGDTIHGMKEVDDLIRLYKKPRHYFYRASLKDMSGDLVGARADYNQAITIDSSYWDAYFNLAASYFNQTLELIHTKGSRSVTLQDFTNALSAIEAALQLRPDDRYMLEGKMVMLKELEKFKK